MLQETYVKLQHELSLAEEKLRKANKEGKLQEAEKKALDKGIAKANNGIKVGNSRVLAIPMVMHVHTYTNRCTGYM